MLLLSPDVPCCQLQSSSSASVVAAQIQLQASCMTGGEMYLPVRTSHSVVQVDANVRSNKGWAATDYKVHCFRCGDHCTVNMTDV
jgi:hypothetical protein